MHAQKPEAASSCVHALQYLRICHMAIYMRPCCLPEAGRSSKCTVVRQTVLDGPVPDSGLLGGLLLQLPYWRIATATAQSQLDGCNLTLLATVMPDKPFVSNSVRCCVCYAVRLLRKFINPMMRTTCAKSFGMADLLLCTHCWLSCTVSGFCYI